MIDRIPLSRKRTTSKTISRYHRYLWIITVAAIAVSCGSKKPKVITTKAEAREVKQQQETSNISKQRVWKSSKQDEIIEDPEEFENIELPASLSMIDAAIAYARDYEGVRYRYGGSTSDGMDCSGLINISFDKAGEQVPRTSMSLFDASNPINIKEIQKGDLMFFATGRNRKKINHVALVVEVTPAEILFIHATVSKGVIISSFNEPYWLGKYLSAGRLF